MKKNRQPKQKPGRQKEKKNHELSVITYLFLGLFVLMTGYFIYFEAVLSPEVIDNPYNARLDAFAERIIRGDILSSDGTVLARTSVSDDGTETREYPYANLFAHVVGYSTRGNTGIESLANYYLLTSSSSAVEQLKNQVKDQKSQGDSVVTTLDLNLQQTAYDALGKNRGAVVVLEVRTGRILAMVSKPDYDPGQINEKWDTWTAEDSADSGSVLYNRATQGLYAPGSTFKILTLLEYMRENPDYAAFTYQCKGKITEGNYTISCYNKKAHGSEDLTKAFAKSCNAAFASIGLSLDETSFRNTCEELLFNQELPSPLTYSKSSFSLKEDASQAEQMVTAIGQGETVVSPFHMALLASAIANDGILMQPYLLEKVVSDSGETVKTFDSEEYGSLMTEEEASVLTEYMKAVVESGTGSKLSNLGFETAGKTGTAEYTSDKSKSHAWFVGFSDTGDQDIAVCVLVEERGSGSEYAVPIARQLFQTWYADKTR